MVTTESGTQDTMRPDRAAVAALVKEQPELFHIVCCDDDDLALCGADTSALAWTEGHGEQFCTVCHDLDPNDVFCPKGRPCPY